MYIIIIVIRRLTSPPPPPPPPPPLTISVFLGSKVWMFPKCVLLFFLPFFFLFCVRRVQPEQKNLRHNDSEKT